MSGFALLWSKLLRSSLWVQESKETRLVWVAMLALKDHDGVIQSSVVGLADAAKISVEECREALRVLLSPDPDDSSGVEEGRRIREVAGGWQIVNNDLYRFSTEAKREFWRTNKAEYRAKLKMPPAQQEKFDAAVESEFKKRDKKESAKVRGQKAGAQALISVRIPVPPAEQVSDAGLGGGGEPSSRSQEDGLGVGGNGGEA